MSIFEKLGRKKRYRTRMADRPATMAHFGVTLPTDPDLVPDYVIDLIYSERYEAEEARICQQELRAGDRVLELGAGIGFIGSLAAKLCGSDNVRTYEANPLNEPIVRRTHALNDVTPDLRLSAIAATNGPITFYQNDNVISSSLVDRNFGGETVVDGVALADVLTDFQPNIIICDIEGAEIDVFRDADLATVDKILIELHPKIVGDAANDQFVSMIEKAGFRFVRGRRRKVAYFCR